MVVVVVVTVIAIVVMAVVVVAAAAAVVVGRVVGATHSLTVFAVPLSYLTSPLSYLIR